MIAKGIKVQWWGGVEYIPFDAASPRHNITRTYERWRGEERFVEYNTHSRVTSRNGFLEIEIQYLQKENNHLPAGDVCWGTSTILIPKGANSGFADWRDTNDTSYNGKSKWKFIGKGLTSPRAKVRVSAFQRKQSEFKSALVGLEPCCAITGERTLASLEAAHVISVADDGLEILDNGILLRADLHRLLDARLFRFDVNGKVAGVGKLSVEYRELLRGKRLSERNRSRLQQALNYVSEMHGKSN